MEMNDPGECPEHPATQTMTMPTVAQDENPSVLSATSISSGITLY